uniref:Uncharacterized protein n=1 Tax=Myotis myotis TaxID=51298 RepID=A0A7J7ZXY9_MYOMY|nr:hypothetical protein mMyoMyo1_009798 [Myotis myotis]
MPAGCGVSARGPARAGTLMRRRHRSVQGSGQSLAPKPITWGALLCLGLGGGLGQMTASSSAILMSHSAALGTGRCSRGVGEHQWQLSLAPSGCSMKAAPPLLSIDPGCDRLRPGEGVSPPRVPALHSTWNIEGFSGKYWKQ